MWRYKWTQKRAELTEDLKIALYDESQGIIDIAITPYVMARIVPDRTAGLSTLRTA